MIRTTLKVATFPALWPIHVWRFWNAPIDEEEQGWPALIVLPDWVPSWGPIP